MNRLPVILACAVLTSGCAGFFAHRESEARAERHMETADSLEAALHLAEAVAEYRVVAEQYPASAHHTEAVRKTALLLSNPDNPAADDNAAIVWFDRYTQLPITDQEKEYARGYAALLGRIMALRSDITHRQAVSDSLEVANRQLGISVSRLNADLAGRNKRLQELENELKKLREVDVRISRTRGK